MNDSVTDRGNDQLSDDTVPPVSRGHRWWFPVLVLVAVAIAQPIGWWWADDDSSKESTAVVLSCAVGVLLTAFWWVFLSRFRVLIRLAGVVVAVAGLALFVFLFRMEGQTGNFVPHFALRSTPRAEDLAVEYFEKSGASLDQPAITSGALQLTDEDWPRFGGPREDHIVRNVSLRRDWQDHPPEQIWRHPVGPAWSSFVVVDRFLFTQEQRGTQETVVCYDAETGQQLWLYEDEVRFQEPASGAGPRSTPTFHDSRLYALGATGILNCLDPVSGDLHWSVNIVDDAGTDVLEWGMSGAPLIHEDLVIVNPGGDGAAVAAYDRLSGQKRWAGSSHKAGYASPQIVTLADVPQLLIYRSAGLSGHELASGEELWSFDWTNMTGLNIAQPVLLPDGGVFISSGYGAGCAVVDVSREGETWKAVERWSKPNRFKLKFNGGILRDGFVYGLDEGILSCFDLQKRKRAWKRGRYNFGQVVMVGDDLLVATESGKVVLVEVTPDKAVEVAEFQAIEGKTWNHPVVNRGRLYIRNAEEAACYDVGL